MPTCKKPYLFTVEHTAEAICVQLWTVGKEEWDSVFGGMSRFADFQVADEPMQV